MYWRLREDKLQARGFSSTAPLDSPLQPIAPEAKPYLKLAQCFPVSPRLWTVLVGNPSAKKTPAMDAAVRPLRDHQMRLHAALLDHWRQEQLAAAEEKGKKGEKDEPHLPQFVISDTTPEKLVEVLSQQDRGVLLMSDELAGWLEHWTAKVQARVRPRRGLSGCNAMTVATSTSCASGARRCR